jgi:hypothetical protein
MQTVPLAIVFALLNLAAWGAIRYEALRKDAQQNKKDLSGVAGIARNARDDGHRLEIMVFYLALSVLPEDPQRRDAALEKVMGAMFEAATRKP